jgi:MOSC domain-containing protein YiiM
MLWVVSKIHKINEALKFREPNLTTCLVRVIDEGTVRKHATVNWIMHCKSKEKGKHLFLYWSIRLEIEGIIELKV